MNLQCKREEQYVRAQVMYPYASSFEQTAAKLEYDMCYLPEIRQAGLPANAVRADIYALLCLAIAGKL